MLISISINYQVFIIKKVNTKKLLRRSLKLPFCSQLINFLNNYIVRN